MRLIKTLLLLLNMHTLQCRNQPLYMLFAFIALVNLAQYSKEAEKIVEVMFKKILRHRAKSRKELFGEARACETKETPFQRTYRTKGLIAAQARYKKYAMRKTKQAVLKISTFHKSITNVDQTLPKHFPLQGILAAGLIIPMLEAVQNNNRAEFITLVRLAHQAEDILNARS